MAKRMIEELTDDIDGSKADETFSFAYDGTAYEIELSKKNRTAFDKAIGPYVSAARTVRSSNSATQRGRRAKSDKRSDLNEIRTWAKASGYTVSDRGRVAAEVVEAYDAVH